MSVSRSFFETVSISRSSSMSITMSISRSNSGLISVTIFMYISKSIFESISWSFSDLF